MVEGIQLFKPSPSSSQLFRPAKAVSRPLKIVLYGDYETGKTHFILTCPQPIYVIDTESGVAPLLRKPEFANKEIYVCDVLQEEGVFKEVGGVMVLDEVECLNVVEKALSQIPKDFSGTIAIDTLSDLWSYCEEYMKREIGEIGRKMLQWDWKIANTRYNNIMASAIARPNAVFVGTARTKPEYVGAQPTGFTEPRWQERTPWWVDVVIKMEKIAITPATQPLVPADPVKSIKTKFTGGNVQYTATIVKCRHERQFNRKIEDLTYDKLVKILEES